MIASAARQAWREDPRGRASQKKTSSRKGKGFWSYSPAPAQERDIVRQGRGRDERSQQSFGLGAARSPGGGLGPGRRDVRPGRVPSPFTTESAHVRRRGERYGVLHKRDALIQRRRQTRRSQTRMMSCRRRVPLEPGDIRFVPLAQGRGRDLG